VYGHFRPKTVRHYIFGIEMSYLFVSVPKCLWDTSAPVPKYLNILWRAEVSISALVPKYLGQIGGMFMFLHSFTTSRHICTIHHDLPTASQDILYIRNHTQTFTFDSLTLLRPCEQFHDDDDHHHHHEVVAWVQKILQKISTVCIHIVMPPAH